MIPPFKPKNRKSSHIAVEEQLELTQHIHSLGRAIEENRVVRLEARELRRRLSPPDPEGPFGHADGFSESIARIEKWGTRFPNLADVVGNGVSKATIVKEMYQKRRRMRNSKYMHHFSA